MEFEVITTEAGEVPASATQYMVRMRDGVRLATDVYLPDGTAPTQTVLVRICYDKNGRYTFMDLLAPFVTNRGYAFVVQDVRGKFRSEGTTMAFVHESHDGYDTLEWISNQPWSDGRVGMFGDSYYGFTQWAAVASGHRALRAIVPRVTSADLGMVNSGRHRGPEGDIEDVDWFVSASYLSHFWLDQFIHDYPIDIGRRPLRDAFEAAFDALGKRSNSFDVVVPRKIPLQVYPDGHPFDAKPVPVLHSVGWFDNLQIPHMRDYVELLSRPEWAPLQYLIADSVDHENYHLELAPIEEHVEHDHIVNDDALQRLMPLYLEPALEFFDVFLKGANPVDSIPRVRWHLGHEVYHESAIWPPAGAVERRLFLGDLSSASAGEGTLNGAGVVQSDSASWVHDPTDLVPSAVENSFSFLYWYPDEAATGRREDVLVFTSAPLTEALDLTGPVDLYARVSSSAPTTDVYCKLLDVDEEGHAHLIVRGQGHVLEPSSDRTSRIEMGHTGYRVRPGHRLRVHVSSSDFPEYVPHPGTDENPWLAEDLRPSTQTLHTDAVAPSYLRLTVNGA